MEHRFRKSPGRAPGVAAPRFCTVVVKSPFSQASSLTACAAATPSMVAWCQSGYWVLEWLPQIVTFFTSVTSRPVLVATCDIARF